MSTAAEILRSIRTSQGKDLVEYRPVWPLPPGSPSETHEWCGVLCILAKSRGTEEEAVSDPQRRNGE